jgi:hypothetical protein
MIYHGIFTDETGAQYKKWTSDQVNCGDCQLWHSEFFFYNPATINSANTRKTHWAGTVFSSDSGDTWSANFNIGDAGYDGGLAGTQLALLSLNFSIGQEGHEQPHIWVYDTRTTDASDKPSLQLFADGVDAWNRADALFLYSQC